MGEPVAAGRCRRGEIADQQHRQLACRQAQGLAAVGGGGEAVDARILFLDAGQRQPVGAPRQRPGRAHREHPIENARRYFRCRPGDQEALDARPHGQHGQRSQQPHDRDGGVARGGIAEPVVEPQHADRGRSHRDQHRAAEQEGFALRLRLPAEAWPEQDDRDGGQHRAAERAGDVEQQRRLDQPGDLARTAFVEMAGAVAQDDLPGLEGDDRRRGLADAGDQCERAEPGRPEAAGDDRQVMRLSTAASPREPSSQRRLASAAVRLPDRIGGVIAYGLWCLSFAARAIHISLPRQFNPLLEPARERPRQFH